ncbi:MAG: ABC transporter substrate-binding protein [Tepidisphaeraceae bacterium]
MNRRFRIAAVVVLLVIAFALLILNSLPRSGTQGIPKITAATMPATQPSQPYSVEMSPMGRVTFKAVPRRIVTVDANYNDMLVAVRHNHGLIASGYANNKFDGYYTALPSVDSAFDDKLKYFSTGGGGSLFDKETLYGLHADVHHIDPVQLSHSRGWSKADVDEIAANVAPFFANRYSRTNDYKGPEPYEYYDVWGLSSKMGEAYHDAVRIAKLRAVYDEMVAAIQAKLPPVEKRPRVGIVMYSNNGFLPYSMAKGFDTEQYRAVGAVDAFAGVRNVAYSAGGGNTGGTRLDLEGMISINPDVLITPFAILPGMRHNFDALVGLKNDPLAKRLSAFQNDRLYPGGTPLQGPIALLFQAEMAAKQIYPELFGPYRDDQKYPAAEQLFDRQRVADILNAPSENSAS